MPYIYTDEYIKLKAQAKAEELIKHIKTELQGTEYRKKLKIDIDVDCEFASMEEMLHHVNTYYLKIMLSLKEASKDTDIIVEEQEIHIFKEWFNLIIEAKRKDEEKC